MTTTDQHFGQFSPGAEVENATVNQIQRPTSDHALKSTQAQYRAGFKGPFGD
jgi:hypothetical protein